jgi:hypothetical protein
MTVMECLHRFCDDCISKSLRLGKKECPTCRVKCSSRRSLRPDVNLDALIARIYPDLDSYEADEDSYIEQVNKTLPKPSFLAPDSSNQQKKRLRSTSSTTSTTTTPTTSLNSQPALTSTSSSSSISLHSSTSSKSSKSFRKDSEQYFPTQHSRKLKHRKEQDSPLEERNHQSSSSSSTSGRKTRRLSTEEDGDNIDNTPRPRFEMNEEDDEYGLVLSPRSNSPSFSPPLEPETPNGFQEDNNKGHNRSGRGASSRVIVDMEGAEDEEMTFQQGEGGNRHLQHHNNRLAETESDNSAVYYYPHIPARLLSFPAVPLPPSTTTPSSTSSIAPFTPSYPQSSQPSLALAHIHMSSAVAPIPTNPDVGSCFPFPSSLKVLTHSFSFFSFFQYISFMLVPHPRAKSLRPLHTPHFHAPKKTTVAALLKYIAQSYNVREAGIFRLYTELVATSFLSSHITLEEIHLTQVCASLPFLLPSVLHLSPFDVQSSHSPLLPVG